MSEFLDQLVLTATAGDGGRGCVSFRREKYVPRGGPDGGNGGRGGHVILKADSQLTTLSHLRANSLIRAGRGGHGSGSNKTGSGGKDVVIRLPIGTVIRDAETGELVADLVEDGQEVIASQGGRGGLGNAAFASPTNRAPRHAQPGEDGGVRKIELELKLLADVGIIGLPNAGKSTLTARISAARPKTAPYPFTTLHPVLGVVDFDDRGFVVADIPGLIEGAHAGSGLGHKFLRHIERTKILLHLVDLTSLEFEPEKSIEMINSELRLFKPELVERPQVIVGNKLDAGPPQERIERLGKEASRLGLPYCCVSAVTGAGIKEMIREIIKLLDSIQDNDVSQESLVKGERV